MAVDERMLPRLLLLFTTVPLVELLLLLHVGKHLGPFTTLSLILLTGALGAWLARTQGLKVLHRLTGALSEGRLPREEVLEGLLVLAAGLLLLTPGLLSDATGLFLLLPPCRTWARQRLESSLERHLQKTAHRPGAGPSGSASDEVIIDAEVMPAPSPALRKRDEPARPE